MSAFFGKMFGNSQTTSQPGQSSNEDVLQDNILNNIGKISLYVSSGFLKTVKDDLNNILVAIQKLKRTHEEYKKSVELLQSNTFTAAAVQGRIDQMNEINGKDEEELKTQLIDLKNQLDELTKKNDELKAVNSSPFINQSGLNQTRDGLLEQIAELNAEIKQTKNSILQPCIAKLNVINANLLKTVELFENYKNDLNTIINKIQDELGISQSNYSNSVPIPNINGMPPPPSRPPPVPPSKAPPVPPSRPPPVPQTLQSNTLLEEINSRRANLKPIPRNNGAEETKENGPTGGKFFNKKGGYYYPTSSSSKRNKKSIGRRKKNKRTNKTRR